jgi:hypothetical protein
MENELTQIALRFSIASGAVSTFCDHVEHNEPADRDAVLGAAAELRAIAKELANAISVDVSYTYAERIEDIETRNLLFDGSAKFWSEAEDAVTWRQLQLIQVEHDRHYHPDVIGLTKSEQLRHYAFHAAKLAGIFALNADEDIMRTMDRKEMKRLIADVAIFGIKLSTVMNERLPEEPLQR